MLIKFPNHIRCFTCCTILTLPLLRVADGLDTFFVEPILANSATLDRVSVGGLVLADDAAGLLDGVDLHDNALALSHDDLSRLGLFTRLRIYNTFLDDINGWGFLKQRNLDWFRLDSLL